ncbi:MAG TPA: CsbD family protein [Rhizobiaceae bacterium]|nr:CsbD family protein [Rhizobiaceae bacterium]
MNEDRIKGKAKDVVGSARKAVGKATNDKKLERAGKADQVEGKVQNSMGKAKDAIRGK